MPIYGAPEGTWWEEKIYFKAYAFSLTTFVVWSASLAKKQLILMNCVLLFFFNCIFSESPGPFLFKHWVTEVVKTLNFE